MGTDLRNRGVATLLVLDAAIRNFMTPITLNYIGISFESQHHNQRINEVLAHSNSDLKNFYTILDIE